MKATLLLLFLIVCSLCLGWSFFTHSRIAVAALESIEPSLLEAISGGLPLPLFNDWIGLQASFVDVDRYFVRELVPGHSFRIHNYPGIEGLTMSEILELPGMSRNALGALITAFFDVRNLSRSDDFAGTSYAIARLFHFASDLTMPLHVVNNNDGQLTGQPGLHVRIESILGNFFFRSEMLLRQGPRIFGDEEIPVVLFESIRKSMEQSKVFEAADMKRKSDTAYRFAALWRDVKEVFIEATSRAVYLCASLLMSALSL